MPFNEIYPCPSLLNGWHSQTAERLFGVLGFSILRLIQVSLYIIVYQ